MPSPHHSLAFLAVLVSAACSSDDIGSVDAAVTAPDAGSTVVDALVLPPPTACPTSGKGGIVVAGATCVLVTPAATGAAADGEAAEVPSYALAPSTGSSGELVVFLNGSGGSPAGGAVDPVENVYTAALASGHHVIGLSYRSALPIGTLCSGDDACYLPTRLTVVTGSYQSGAAVELADMQATEGIHQRLSLLLDHLVATDPTGGWDQFRVPGVASDPGDAVVWSKIIVTGHSQGGGHAALLGKLHAVARVVSLSSPCDRVGKAVASWLHPDATWNFARLEALYASN